MRHAICYTSNLDEDIDLSEISKLLHLWQERNEALDIKGLLLYSEGNFFQIREGEKERVLEVFEKIRGDERHNRIVQVIGRDIEQGAYDSYMVDIVGEE